MTDVHLVTDATWEAMACGLTSATAADSDDARATDDPAKATCTPCRAAAGALTALEAMRLARRVGIARARSAEAATRYKETQATARPVFAQMRRRGTLSQEISVGGQRAALITIEQGKRLTSYDENAIIVIAAGNDPAEFEQFVQPSAWSDPKVIALVAREFPHLAGRRLTARALARYKQEADDHDGGVLNKLTGEREPVATVTQYDPVGEYDVRWSGKGQRLLLDALDSGAIRDNGEADGDENLAGPPAALPAVPEPTPAGVLAERGLPAGDDAEPLPQAS